MKEKIKIFPKGKFYIAKLGKYLEFTEKFFKEIIDNFNNEEILKPIIDKDHNYSESYGKIDELIIEKDGLYGIVEFNSEGEKIVKDSRYRSFSPSFGKFISLTKKVYENVLYAVSLTNFPALSVAIGELQDQVTLDLKPVINLFELEIEQTKKNNDGGQKMNELAIELGFKPETSEAVLVDSVRKIKAETIELSQKLEKEAKAKDEAEKKAIELSQKLQKIEQETLKKEADETINQAIELGQILPVVKDIWVNRYLRAKDEVLQELSLIPKKEIQRTSSTDQKIELSFEMAEKMANVGLDPKNPEDVAEFMKYNKEAK